MRKRDILLFLGLCSYLFFISFLCQTIFQGTKATKEPRSYAFVELPMDKVMKYQEMTFQKETLDVCGEVRKKVCIDGIHIR